MRWDDIEHSVSLSTLLIVFAASSTGSAVHETTAGRWLGTALFSGILDMPPLWAQRPGYRHLHQDVLLQQHGNCVHNPADPDIAEDGGGPAGGDVTFVAPAALTSSLPIILVTSSPANLMAYRSGYFTARTWSAPG